MTRVRAPGLLTALALLTSCAGATSQQILDRGECTPPGPALVKMAGELDAAMQTTTKLCTYTDPAPKVGAVIGFISLLAIGVGTLPVMVENGGFYHPPTQTVYVNLSEVTDGEDGYTWYVLAHEWGHAAQHQRRVGPVQAVIERYGKDKAMELHADCIAGGFLAKTGRFQSAMDSLPYLWKGSKGDARHPPGAVRVQIMNRCAQRAGWVPPTPPAPPTYAPPQP